MARDSSVNRAEAEARVAADSGDEDDLVYIRWGEATEKAPRRSMGEVYHEDPDCFYLQSNEAEEMTRHAAQIRWKYPCLKCTLPTHDRVDLAPGLIE